MKKISGLILLVDDDTDSLQILSALLEQDGHSVVCVGNGEEAIDALKRETFDLVILDLILPKMSGFDVLSWIHENSGSQTLPVIVVSAVDSMKDVVRAIELGAVDYVSKPYNQTLLRTRIHSVLEKKQAAEENRRHLIEEKRKAEEALQAIETRMSTVISTAPIILFVLDSQGVITLLEGQNLSQNSKP